MKPHQTRQKVDSVFCGLDNKISKLYLFRRKSIKEGLMGLFKKKIKCPYCEGLLEVQPKRKKKCPHCEKYIFIRDHIMVTKENAEIIDNLKMFEFSVEQYLESKNELGEQFGFEPKCKDVIWHVCNKEIIKKRNNRSALGTLYYNMAIFLDNAGKDPFEMLKQSAKAKLKSFKKEGVDIVEITGGNNCTYCMNLKDKIYKIDEALDQMPIPHKDCINVIHNKKGGFCTCQYWPTSEVALEWRGREDQ